MAAASASLAFAASSKPRFPSFSFLFSSSRPILAVPSSCLILCTSEPAASCADFSFPRTASAIDLDFSLRAAASSSALRLRSARSSSVARASLAGEPGGVGGGGVEPAAGASAIPGDSSDSDAGSPPSAAASSPSFLAAFLLRLRFSISSPAFVAIPVTSALTHALVRCRSSLDSLSAALEAAAASRMPSTDAPAVLTRAPTTPPNPRTALTPRTRMSSRTSSRDSGRDEASSVGDDGGGGDDGDEDSAVVSVVPSDADADDEASSSRDVRRLPGGTGSPVSSAPSSRESPRGASPAGSASPTMRASTTAGAFASSAEEGAVEGPGDCAAPSTPSARFGPLAPCFGSLSTSPALSRPFLALTAGFRRSTSS